MLAPGSERARLYGAFVSVLGPVFVDLVTTTTTQGGKGFEVVVPEGIKGQSYFLLSSCKERVTDDTIVAGPVIVEVSYLFIDSFGSFFLYLEMKPKA